MNRAVSFYVIALIAVCSASAVAQINRPQLAARIDRVVPNPFNPINGSISIEYVVSVAADISLKIFTVDGEYVATLLDGPVGAGKRTASWDGRAADGAYVANGLYICQLRVGNVARSQLVLVMRESR